MPDTMTILNKQIHSQLQIDNERLRMELIANELKNFSQRELHNYLASVIACAYKLGEIAGNSYLHGNGFYKIPLIKYSSHTLRLHIWRTNASAEENLHSHRWPFASTIVLGSLISELWEDGVGDDAKTFQELKYLDKNRQLDTVGECRIRIKETCRKVAGDCYWMAADELHRIVNVGNELTVTLMMRPRNTRSWARNICIDNCTPNTKPSYLSIADLKLVLEEVIASLTAQRSY